MTQCNENTPEIYKVNVIANCPHNKLKQCLVTIQYIYLPDKEPIGIDSICHSRPEGVKTCYTCLQYFRSHITHHGLPNDHEVISPDFSIFKN